MLKVIKDYKPTRKSYLILLVIGLILLGFYKKSWFVAATIDGNPVLNFEVIDRLNKQFRTQTLTQIINEKIIVKEAAKNNIKISASEIDQKITELEKNVGGKDMLDSLLSQQGQTRELLKNQIKLQLTIEKLFAKDATVSAAEVDTFIKTNQNQLTATDSAGQTKEAQNYLKQQKLSKIFNEKFQSLKEKAKVNIF